MKTKLFSVAIIVAAASLSLQKTIAQNTSPFWSLNGNSNTTNSSKLGTTDNKNLGFYTHDLQRMTINAAKGDVGIGIINPADRLHVNSTAGENAFRAAINGSTKLLVHSGGGVSVGSGITPPANGLFVSGNTGIGTEHPKVKLHVFLGSSGLAGNPSNVPLMVENSNNSYISILAPNANETGVLFGNPQSIADGGLIFNNLATPGGLQFRTNNNITQMALTVDGNLGLGTTNPGFYKTQINVNATGFGLDIQNVSAGGDWELFPGPDLELFFRGTFTGSFDRESGAYTAVSDKRLKTNIRPMPAVLDKINQLKPSVYQFINSKDQKEYNGFIAQDVLGVFPDLVIHNVNKAHDLDVYTLNYSGFGIIAIKGIQELQQIIEEQKKINDAQKVSIRTLEDRVTKLEALLMNASSQKNLQNVASLKDASIEQNEPNPLSQNTIIRYHLPQGSNGQINIFNESGNLVRTLTTNESGELNLNAYDLKAGTYTYTFIVNGKTIDSKKMVVVK